MPESKDFIYLLNMSESNFLQEIGKHKSVIQKHFQYLKKLKKEKKLILAGTSLDGFYEIVIFKELTTKNAEKIMNKDPLIKEEIIPGSLYDFRASLVTDDEVECLLESKKIDYNQMYNPDVVTHIFGTITGRPTFINDATDEEMKIMGDHFQYLKKNFDEKKLILAGPILAEGKFGVIILSVRSLNEAKEIMKNDPSAKSKLMKLGLHTFQLFLM